MGFEPAISAPFEPRISIVWKPFEHNHSAKMMKSPVRRLTSRLLAALQLFYKRSENNLMDCISHAAGFVGNSRSETDFWVHPEGGSK